MVRTGHQCADRERRQCEQHQSTVKKWQTCHRVLRCWPNSTVCQSPGHGIGRAGLMVTSHTSDQISGTWGEFFGVPWQVQVQFPLPETDVTPSKMVDGSGNWNWTWYGASKYLPILLTVYYLIKGQYCGRCLHVMMLSKSPSPHRKRPSMIWI